MNTDPVWLVGHELLGWLYMRGPHAWAVRRAFPHDGPPESIRAQRRRCLDDCPPEERAGRLYEAGHEVICPRCEADEWLAPEIDGDRILCPLCKTTITVSIEGE